MNAREAADYLRVSPTTLKKMDKDIRPARLTGGKRSYKVEWLNEYLSNSRKGKSG